MRQGHACASPWSPRRRLSAPSRPVRPLVLSSPRRPTYPNDSLFCYGAESASGTSRRLAVVPNFGRDRLKADMPPGWQAYRSDENDPERTLRTFVTAWGNIDGWGET